MIIDIHAHVTAPDSLYVYKAGLLSHRGGHGRGGVNATDEDIIKALNSPVFGGSSHLDQLKEAGTDLQIILGILLISQFWTLANDIYDARQAKRLFGLVGAGASLGGASGAALTASLVEDYGAYSMLLLSAFLLTLCMTIVIMICIILVLMGTFMEEISIMLLTMPVLVPLLAAHHIDLTWFGILVIKLMTIGLISPPVGMNVFVINSLARDVPMSRTFLGVMPFFVAELFRVVLLVAFPALSLWLPHLLAR